MSQLAPMRESWYASGMDVYLNRWFTSYAEARAALQTEGGYLLPYRRHCFICGPGAIELLGLDPGDPDWERIEWDCVQPADPDACRRLRERVRNVLP